MKELIDGLRGESVMASSTDQRVMLAEAAEALEFQAREIASLHKDYDEASEDAMIVARQLAALKAQPSGVVLPRDPEKSFLEWASLTPLPPTQMDAYRAGIAEVARLNQPASAGDERAAFEAAFENTFYSGCFERDESGEYVGRGLQGAWLGWRARAARAAAPSAGSQGGDV